MPKNVDLGQAKRYVSDNIQCNKWASIFAQNLEDKGGSVQWKCNMEGVHTNMKKR